MPDNVQQDPPAFTAEKLGPEHGNRVQVDVPLASHRHAQKVGVMVTPGEHAALEVSAYWASFRVAMDAGELASLRDAITEVLVLAGVESASDAAESGGEQA